MVDRGKAAAEKGDFVIFCTVAQITKCPLKGLRDLRDGWLRGLSGDASLVAKAALMRTTVMRNKK